MGRDSRKHRTRVLGTGRATDPCGDVASAKTCTDGNFGCTARALLSSMHGAWLRGVHAPSLRTDWRARGVCVAQRARVSLQGRAEHMGRTEMGQAKERAETRLGRD